MAATHPHRRRGFWSDRTGAAAVEFGLVAAPFAMLIIGVIEAGLMFFGATVLEGGVGDAARLVRTGQVKAAADPVAAFRTKLCQGIVLVACDKLVIEVLSYPTFTDAAADSPRYRASSGPAGKAGDLMPRAVDFGMANSVMVSRVQYRYPFLTPVGMLLSGTAENSILLLSTAVFKNEPYP